MRIDRATIATWRMPVVLALLTAIGLLSALLGDDAWDVVSWLALLVPVAVCLWYGAVAGRRRDRVRTSGP